MAIVSERIQDLKLILTTDKRLWAASGFVTVALVVWLATDSWRRVEEEIPKEPYVKKEIDRGFATLVDDFNQSLVRSKEQREEMKVMVDRTANTLEVEQKELDWQINSLINQLDHMSSKVNSMVAEVGRDAIDESNLRRRERVATE